MEKIKIFGHRKPDTDSVCSSIALSYLKNQQGMNCEPCVLGSINNETKYALKYFGIKEPKYLNDVKVQVKDIEYRKNMFLNSKSSIDEAFKFMSDNIITSLPLIDEEKELTGLVTLKSIGKELIDGDINKLYTSYQNIIATIDGQEIMRFDEEINGHLMVAAFNSSSFVENIDLNANDILICGDRFNIVKKALESKIKLLIVVGNYHLTEDLLAIANENKVNVIYTPNDTYTTATRIRLSNYVETIKVNENPVYFLDTDYRSEVLDTIDKCGHTNYPIINKKGECLGLLKVTDTSNYKKSKIILTDHNQKVQSVEGIDEAEILEVVDHHNLGTIGTSMPISFRSMPVGCTCTIVYKLFQEAHIEIPEDIAGLMLSAILSDTMIFKSPTTTAIDIDAAMKLANICNIDVDKYGYEMFKAGSSIKGMSEEEVLNQDIKSYKVDDASIAISQVFTMDFEDIEANIDKYINLLDGYAKQGYKAAVMFVTDVIKNGSYLIYNTQAEEIVAEAYDIKNIFQGIYLKDFVSRKKQMLPKLIDVIEKKI